MISKEEFNTYFELKGKVHRRIDKVINMIAKVRDLNKKYECGERSLWSICYDDNWSICTSYGKETIVNLEVCCYCVPDQKFGEYRGPVTHNFKFPPEYLTTSDVYVVNAEKLAFNKGKLQELANKTYNLERERKQLIENDMIELARLKALYE